MNQICKAWCVFGDFNSIRRQEERKSLISVSDYNREINEFNAFIEKSELVDIPMVGRKFTWYKLNGLVKSGIDSVLISKELLEVWSHNKQIVLDRSVSHHCAIVLKDMCGLGSETF